MFRNTIIFSLIVTLLGLSCTHLIAQSTVHVGTGVTYLEGNSTLPCFGYTFWITHSDTMPVKAAVTDSAIFQLPGTTHMAGFASCAPPIPGQPSWIWIEPGDTLMMEFVYFPNSMIGTSTIELQLFDLDSPTDTTYWTLDVYSGPFVSSHEINSTQELGIFPNPASDYLYLVGASRQAPYIIVDMNGRVLMSSTLEDRIDVSELPSGVYLLSAEGTAMTFVKTD